jgi:uncharacterized membrane protein
LLKVMVSVEAAFALTLVGENASVTVGGTGVNVMGVGHAVADVPAVVGAELLAVPAVIVMVTVSAAPIESVTVNVSVSVPEPGVMVTCAAFFTDPNVIPLVPVHA